MFRLCVVGSGGVGKSSLTIRYLKNEFTEYYDPTLEETYRKEIEYNGKLYDVEIIDTAGQEEYSSFRDSSVATGDAFLVLFAINSTSSWHELKDLRSKIIQDRQQISSIPMVIVANKLDLEGEREVNKEEVLEYCNSSDVNVPLIETSAKPQPKQIPRTIDNTRVVDDTIVEPQDDEVIYDEESDELATYFRCEVVPKVLITSSDRSKVKTVQFMEELKRIIPNSEVRVRKGLDLKKIIPQAKEKGFTALVVVNEDRKLPNAMIISHLPDGPTAHFKLSSVKLGKDIKNHGRMTSHRPEVILNNFGTRLGHCVARLLAALFPHDPQFQGRQCVTFHNQRDFIFFRRHRYIFKNQKKAGLQELGPRFTLKLRSLQRGSFDSKFGEYEWVHKRKEMDTSRKKFFL